MTRDAIDRYRVLVADPPWKFGGDNRSPSEWRVLARRLADLVDSPVKPRDLIRRACRELGIGPNAARNALATADGNLLTCRDGHWRRSW